MSITEPSAIALTVILILIAALLVWLSLTMAAAEGAVARVTRASLNNLILEVQTDGEASQFTRMKKIDRIHKVQHLIADRYSTSGSCAFFRITCNVLDGVLVACLAAIFEAPLWAELLIGFVFALIVAVVSVLVRPRTAGASKPVDIMLANASLVSLAAAITPFARVGGANGGKAGGKKRQRESDLSDDEELEKIQHEQGRATIDRLVEANDFDPRGLRDAAQRADALRDADPRDHGAAHRHDLHRAQRDAVRHAQAVLALRILPRAGDR